MPARVVLVTGGAAGIGAGIAQRFAEAGDNVAVVDINGTAATTLVEQILTGVSVFAVQADVSDEEQAKKAIETTVARFGPIDVLVNNAGIEVNGTVPDLTAEAFDRQIAVNLRGAFLMAKYTIPKMPKSGGSVVNISSVHAFVSYLACAAYDATKSGLVGLTRAMALDHGAAGIRVNAVCPGYIDTPLMDRWLNSVPNRDETMRQVLALHPGGRIGTPRDVAEAVFFLCSDAATFISGTTLTVDGAMSIAGH